MPTKRRSPTNAGASTYVALFRGINVGGKNKLPMRELVSLFEDAGAEQVRSFIQSGNVLFRGSAKLAAGLPALLAEQISARYGIRTSLTLRTAKELAAVVRKNPFLRDGGEEQLHVVFLAGVPEPARVASLDAGRSPPDELVVRGQEIYLRLPNGMARTKLTNAYFDSKLETTSTARNWRTVLKLLELSQA